MKHDNKLKKIRFMLGLSQQELANELGVSNAFLSRVENGKVPISKGIKFALTTKYNVNGAYLEDKSSEVFLSTPSIKEIIEKGKKMLSKEDFADFKSLMEQLDKPLPNLEDIDIDITPIFYQLPAEDRIIINEMINRHFIKLKKTSKTESDDENK